MTSCSVLGKKEKKKKKKKKKKRKSTKKGWYIGFYARLFSNRNDWQYFFVKLAGK